MTSIDWYYARGNKQMGPVSSADLKRLAGAGDLLSDDLVWREGLTEWAPARSVRGLFDEDKPPATKQAVEQSPSIPTVAGPQNANPAPEKPPAPATPTAPLNRKPSRHPIDALLDSLRGDLNARFVDTAARVFRTCGLYGLLLGMVLTIAFAVIVAIQGNAFDSLLAGVMLLLALGALHYTAQRSCDVLDRLNRTTAGALSGRALPDCVAILSLTAGLITLFGSVPLAVQLAMVPLILLGIASLVFDVYLAMAALNPSALNVTITADEPPASAEAIGAASFLLKLFLRCMPVAFGTGVMAGALMMGYACCEMFLGAQHLQSAQMTAAVARRTLTVSAVLPLAAYLLFLLGTLVLDVGRAILACPGRADKPSKQE
jgi:hypothetical protein